MARNRGEMCNKKEMPHRMGHDKGGGHDNVIASVYAGPGTTAGET